MKGRVDHLLGLSVPLITLSAPAAAQVSDAELAEYGVTVGTIASEVEAPWGLPAAEIPDLTLETGSVDVVVPDSTEERRVVKECFITYRSLWYPVHLIQQLYKTNNTN